MRYILAFEGDTGRMKYLCTQLLKFDIALSLNICKFWLGVVCFFHFFCIAEIENLKFAVTPIADIYMDQHPVLKINRNYFSSLGKQQ